MIPATETKRENINPPEHEQERKIKSIATTKRSRIGILGPWGGNLGDAAIQQTMIDHIRIYYPDAQIYGFSLCPEDTEKRHGIPSFPTGNISDIAWQASQENPKGIYARLIKKLRTSSNASLQSASRWLVRAPAEWKLIREAYQNLRGFDYLIISGGGQLDDYWGGAWSHPYTLLKFSFLARLHKAQIMFVSVGAGPIDAWLSKFFIKWALSIASYRSYRDQKSKNVIAGIGFKNTADRIYPDLAHSLEIRSYHGTPAQEYKPVRPLIGVGPMAYFDPRVWPERDQQVYMNYLSKLAALIVWLLQNEQDVLLFTGEAFHDREVIADLRQLLAEQGISPSDSRVIELPIETVDDLMQQLATTDLIVASRFHGVLLPQLLNKPVLALSYHPKIDDLMADMGQADYCLPIDSFDLDTVKERFESMKANCQTIKATMAIRTQQYREALDEQYQRIFANK